LSVLDPAQDHTFERRDIALTRLIPPVRSLPFQKLGDAPISAQTQQLVQGSPGPHNARFAGGTI
jgi:hypothetical protein